LTDEKISQCKSGSKSYLCCQRLLYRVKKVGIFFLGAGLVYGAICLLAFWGQDLVVVHPVRLPDNHRFQFPFPFTEQVLPTPDGASLSLLWFKVPQARGVVVYYHGNADNLARWGWVSEDIVAQGYDLVVWDYRGFGKSTGHVSEAALLQDAQQVYRFAQGHYPDSAITVFGRSLGTGLATYVAAQHQPHQLILETPYYNFADLAQHYVPFLPHRWLLRYHLTTDEWLRAVKCPVHIFHGTADGVVPYQSGQKLLPLLKPGDTFTTIPEGTHHNLREYPAYQAQLKRLLP
jgi:uncharacterized protein